MSLRGKLSKKKSKLGAKKTGQEDHPAKLDNYIDGNFYLVATTSIIPDPNQPRKYFDEKALDELTESVKQKGILQPVIIRKDEDKILLVAGERRFRAAIKAGLKEIPAVFTTGNPAEIAIIENLQRENLNPIEETEALTRLMEDHKYNQNQLAKVIGKARTTINEALSLNRLPQTIKDESRDINISRRVLVEIAKQKSPQAMLDLFGQVRTGELKGNRIREITRKKPETKMSTPGAILIGKIVGLNSSIQKLNIKTVEKKEKKQLREELLNLIQSIETVLK